MKKQISNSKLIAYSAAAGAALAVAPNAFGTIIHNPNANISFGVGNKQYLTMEGSTAEFFFDGMSSSDSMMGTHFFMFQLYQNGNDGKVHIVDINVVKPLTTGEYVGQNTNQPNQRGFYFYNDAYGWGFTTLKGYWDADNETNYCGVSFDKESGGKVYGWIKVERLTRASGKVISWAYENNGTKIQVGAMPEPATGLALLALGAAGIARYRRK